DYEAAPLLIAFVLGPMIEKALRQSLIISGGSLFFFLGRPIALVALLAALVILSYPLISLFWKERRQQL
ncbi:MAG: tripartite tricarboxylate transporter permease, partial [Candidatus Hodarchaeota archaeon]